jgi:exosortase
MTRSPDRLVRTWPFAVLGIAVLLVYSSVLMRLAQDWWTDENYSHGFLIIPLAVVLATGHRARLRTLTIRPAMITGLLVVAVALLLLAGGTLGAEFFLTRLSFVVSLAGVVLFLFGWGHLRCLAFPLAFLLLMIPLPAIIFNQVAFPLQLLASRLGEWFVSAAGVPVLREGNVIVLATTTLEVAEACSGIRSLVSLLTLSIVLGYFLDPRASVRTVLALWTVPVAIVANAVRVAGTGIASHYYGASAADGFFHTFSGWLVFALASLLLLIAGKTTQFIAPPQRPGTPLPAHHCEASGS